MNELQIFNNDEFGEVRTLTQDGDIWFVAKDVCDALGLSNTTVTINRLDDDEVTKFNLGGRIGETNLINEYGLYSLVLGSRKEEAKKFKRWITHDVIPSIRKHGIYATDDTIDKIISDPDFGINLLQELKKEREEKKSLELKNKQQEQIIGELKPKADYTDKILSSDDLVTITQIAKDYGMTGAQMNTLLHDLEIQYKQSGQWLLYADYCSKGYTHSETYEFPKRDGTIGTTMHTKWTQKGRLFLYNLLKDYDILPLIEQEELISV